MIKKLIYILILFILPFNFAFSKTQKGYVDYNPNKHSLPSQNKARNEAKYLKEADANIKKWENSQTDLDKKFYLQEAMRYYYLAQQANINNIDAHVGLGRVYDAMNIDKFAEEHFFTALNFNDKNPRVNFYFAKFYNSRNDYLTAVYYYKRAYDFGLSKNYELNYNLGIIYEKLADIESAKKFYANALALKPKNLELADKIRLLDELNYGESQYYLFIK